LKQQVAVPWLWRSKCTFSLPQFFFVTHNFFLSFDAQYFPGIQLFRALNFQNSRPQSILLLALASLFPAAYLFFCLSPSAFVHFFTLHPRIIFISSLCKSTEATPCHIEGFSFVDPA
jgi:hypothetical protein